MHKPNDLTREQLEGIVAEIQRILWFDERTGTFDPEISWNMDTIEWVSGVLEDAGLKPEATTPADGTNTNRPRGAGHTGDDVVLRCPQCGERDDLFVRIRTLCALLRHEAPVGGLSITLEDKTPADFVWDAFHCGACGHEGPRQDFEPVG